MNYIIREKVEIELHPKNMNMEDDFCLSKLCRPLICSLKYFRKLPSPDFRAGFSLVPHRSVHTALISPKPPPCYLGFPLLFMFLYPPLDA
jgi:hypothetical protein